MLLTVDLERLRVRAGERLLDAGFAPGAEPIDEGAPDVGAFGAETDGFQYVLAGANAAVEMHLYILADLGHDFG